jgi:hypothetical protein
MQLCRYPQPWPHVPQFLGSDVRSTHEAPQQLSPAAQAWPQARQFAASESRSAQYGSPFGDTQQAWESALGQHTALVVAPILTAQQCSSALQHESSPQHAVPLAQQESLPWRPV